jgi:glycosyltransferase involved in cell wall biosynthesis
VSAAGRTALRSGTPLLVSDTCFFDDLPRDLAPRVDLDRLPEEIQQWASYHSQEHVAMYKTARDSFVRENSFENIAKQHLDLYKAALNANSTVGGG